MDAGSRRIGLVENEEAYRITFVEKVRAIPSVSEVRVWNSAEEFWRDPKRGDVDFLFLDIGLPHMNGVELAGLVSQALPDVPIVMLTSMMTEDLILKAIRSGAIGYVLKSELRDVADVLNIVEDGGAIITPTVALRVLLSLKGEPEEDAPVLTDREKQTLNEIVTGATVAQAARTLGISENTVRAHIKGIYRKMQVSSRVELMRRAIDLGLI